MFSPYSLCPGMSGAKRPIHRRQEEDGYEDSTRNQNCYTPGNKGTKNQECNETLKIHETTKENQACTYIRNLNIDLQPCIRVT